MSGNNTDLKFEHGCMPVVRALGRYPLKNQITTILKLIAGAACFVAMMCVAADSGEAAFTKFKAKMLPQVGHKIAVVGKLDAGKAGWWLSFGGWGLYIEATTTNQTDLAKLNQFGSLRLHTVKAVGTLRHQEEFRPNNPLEQGVPEHFFFDVGDVTVTDSSTGSTKLPEVK